MFLTSFGKICLKLLNDFIVLVLCIWLLLNVILASNSSRIYVFYLFFNLIYYCFMCHGHYFNKECVLDLTVTLGVNISQKQSNRYSQQCHLLCIFLLFCPLLLWWVCFHSGQTPLRICRIHCPLNQVEQEPRSKQSVRNTIVLVVIRSLWKYDSEYTANQKSISTWFAACRSKSRF